MVKEHRHSDKNKYIVAVLLNAVRYEKVWLESNDIVNGGN